MKNDTTTPLQIPDASTQDVLTEILRDGAREMPGKAIEAEVAGYIAARARVAALVGLYAKSPDSANMRANSAFLSADKSRVVVETGDPGSGNGRRGHRRRWIEAMARRKAGTL